MTDEHKPAALPGDNLLFGGQPADLDHIATLMMQLGGGAPGFGGSPPTPLVPSGPQMPIASTMPGASAIPGIAGVPGVPLGLGGPSRPVPQSSGTNIFESISTPGSELTRLSSLGLAEGVDPSLMSLELTPLRRMGRDLPSTQVPSAARIEQRAAASNGLPTFESAPGRSVEPPRHPNGMPAFEGPLSLPFDVPETQPFSAHALGAGHSDRAGPTYYFLGPTDAAPAASTALPQRGPLIRDDFPILSQRINGHRLVWLDSAATTQKPAVVIETEAEFYRRDNSNVHRGAHTLAKRSTDAYEGARRKVQLFLGAAAAEEIVFVRSATEGLNLIANTLGEQRVGEGDEIVVSHLEHHSNIVPWQMLCQRKKAHLRVIPVDDEGDIQLDAYAALLGPRTRIVALTQVSNVLGTLVPIAPMAALAHQHGACVVVDGAQSAAHLPVDVKCLGVDFFAFSGHKLYAPTGIGAVYGRKELLESMPPWQGGGSMIQDVTFERTTYAMPPAKFEAGTGHFAGAVGLGAAIDYLESLGRPNVAAHEQALMHYAIDALSKVPGLRLLGSPKVRIGALPFVMAGYEVTEVARSLDERGIAVRAGHHCAQPILRRFGLEASVRASLGVYSAHDDIDALVAALRALSARRSK
jgi:cysteine desulfurase/selenocysteine lyase